LRINLRKLKELWVRINSGSRFTTPFDFAFFNQFIQKLTRGGWRTLCQFRHLLSRHFTKPSHQ